MSENGNLPAFPTKLTNSPYSGLTKREEFAKAAMQAYAMNQSLSAQLVAELAITTADALLAALEKEKQP